jgi:cytochrome c oxidase cbb3-type subunit 3
MRFSALVPLACLAALFTGCEHTHGYPPDPIPRPSEVEDFATLYRENCAACHGADGQNGPAIDLGNPEYQALVDDTTLRKWISDGMPGTEMPAYARSQGGMLTDAQVTSLIAGMRQRWSRPNVFGAAEPPPYAQLQQGNAHNGEQSYRTRCAVCHASSHQQITSRVFVALIGDQALRSIMIAGRPDIGQPDWSHLGPGGRLSTPLSAQEVEDIVAFLGSLRNPAPATSAATGQSASIAPVGR